MYLPNPLKLDNDILYRTSTDRIYMFVNRRYVRPKALEKVHTVILERLRCKPSLATVTFQRDVRNGNVHVIWPNGFPVRVLTVSKTASVF